MVQNKFIFKEICEQKELENILRLRYEICMKSRLRKFMKENPDNIEIDNYDPLSRHFGLYFMQNNISLPIGYIRVIHDDDFPMYNTVMKLTKQYPRLLNHISSKPDMPFPLMEYFPNKDLINQSYNKLKSTGERVCSPGRLFLLPQFRSLRVGCFIVEAIMSVLGYHLKIKYGMVCCDSRHKPFYQRIGFDTKVGIQDAIVYGKSASFLVGNKNNIPNCMENKLQKMMEMYRINSQIEFIPSRIDETTTVIDNENDESSSLNRVA